MAKAFEMIIEGNELPQLKYALIEKNNGLIRSNFNLNPIELLEVSNRDKWLLSKIVKEGNSLLLAGSTFSLSGNDYSVIQGLDEAGLFSAKDFSFVYPFSAALITLLALFGFLKY